MAISRVLLFHLYTFPLLGLLTLAEPTIAINIAQLMSIHQLAQTTTLITTTASQPPYAPLSPPLSRRTPACSTTAFTVSLPAPSDEADSEPAGSESAALYGLFLCRGDLSKDECLDCHDFATEDVAKQCPGSKQVTIWYEECMLRYSNVSTIFSSLDVSYSSYRTNQKAYVPESYQAAYTAVVLKALNDSAVQASAGGDSSKKFGTKKAIYHFRTIGFPAIRNRSPVYTLAQCTPDLSASDCNDCLRLCIDIMKNITPPSFWPLEAWNRFPSCYARYARDPFYKNTSSLELPPPILPPLLPPSILPLPPPPRSSPGKKKISFKANNLIVIVVPIGVSVVLFIACFCFTSRRARKKLENIREDSVETEITSVKSLQYDSGVIKAATNNLSDENKIGEDEFGPLYKGLLEDGQAIAVKKLSRTPGHDIEEFKNEVALVAMLRHRNLVTLLGYCSEGEDKLLIYEPAPNKSLDYVLFGPQQQILDWSTRYKIIREIAGGMLYLHEDSQLGIIHGDLKASNILLDGNMNVKISNFGVARILGVDKNQGNASEIEGTCGQTSLDYAMHGQCAIKSDVLSFGVLVLEIITGKRNNFLYQPDTPMDLLSYAWKLWSDGSPLDLMDAAEIGPYSKDEATRCIHVALLCVQDDADLRPSMAIVVSMLDGYSSTLSVPHQPGFHFQSTTGIARDRPRSKSMVWSLNEMSISEIEPR